MGAESWWASLHPGLSCCTLQAPHEVICCAALGGQQQPRWPRFTFAPRHIHSCPVWGLSHRRPTADGAVAQDSSQARQMWHLREGITEGLRHRGACICLRGHSCAAAAVLHRTRPPANSLPPARFSFCRLPLRRRAA